MIRITFGSFDLPFAVGDSEEEQPDGMCEELEFLQEKVPARCVFLGEINSQLDSSPGLAWGIEDYYYLMPWEGPEYDWCLFRITRDDNWENFGWSADARIKGVTEPKEAGRKMFRGLMKRWKYDLRKSEYAAYREFLRGI
jgi:hypothetical protein